MHLLTDERMYGTFYRVTPPYFCVCMCWWKCYETVKSYKWCPTQKQASYSFYDKVGVGNIFLPVFKGCTTGPQLIVITLLLVLLHSEWSLHRCQEENQRKYYLLFFPKTKSIVKKQKTERHNKSCASQASTRHSNTQEKREINKTTKR